VFAAESLVEVKATMKSAITEALNELSNSEIDSERPESVRAAS
jgi:hypothetical protein